MIFDSASIKNPTISKLGYHQNTLTFACRVRETFTHNLPLDVKGTILDAGCSKGITTQEISKLYPGRLVYGLDINAQVLPNKHRAGQRFVSGSFYSLANIFSDMQFGAIFLMNNLAFSPLDGDNLKRVVANVYSHTAEDGYILVSQNWSKLVMQRKKNQLVELCRTKDFATRGTRSADVYYAFSALNNPKRS